MAVWESAEPGKFLLRSLTYFKYSNWEFVVPSGLIFAVN